MPYAVNLSWEAANINTLIANGYDIWSVEVDSGGFSAIAPLQAMPILVGDVRKYIFKGSSATEVMPDFRVRAYKSSDQTYDATPIVPTKAIAGYCTLQDVREQGYTQTAYSDAKVWTAIQRATQLIDKISRMWFEPRYQMVSMDGRKIDQLFLKVPIVSVMKVEIDRNAEEIGSFVIYNRHLTHGTVQPDDRANPRVAWGEGRDGVDIRRLYGGGTFLKARKSIKLFGIFGYTEIGPGQYVGETVEDNQMPIDYGITPEPIQRAALRLAIRFILPIEDGDDQINASKVIEEKTRDQSYKLASGSEMDTSYGMSGDLEVDKILQMYPAPFDIGIV